ncbi:MAG: hypothetical protein ACXWQO_01050 [Bdellovibrionota bacterium]
MRFKPVLFSVLLLSGSAILSLGLAEFFFRQENQAAFQHKKSPDILLPDADLGYSGKPNSSGTETFYQSGSSFDAFYTINSSGFRLVPGTNPEAKRCVLIFGDSVAFGLGVSDSENAAALLQKKIPDIRVINLSLSGWGAHQALRILETDREKELTRGCREIRAFYFSQFDHVKRAAGRVPYDLSGPKYTLKNGVLSYVGPFHSQWLSRFNNKYISPSQFGSKILVAVLGSLEAKTEEILIYRAILERMKNILAERYKVPLSVLYFSFGSQPNNNDRSVEIDGIKTIYFDQFLQHGLSRAEYLKKYYLPDECHPNVNGHAQIAKLLANELHSWK